MTIDYFAMGQKYSKRISPHEVETNWKLRAHFYVRAQIR